MTDSGDSSGVVEETYHFEAPAEVVFGVLTDPHRTSRWLPRGFNAESAGTDPVRVRAGSQVREFDVQVVTDTLQMRWRARDGSGLAGSVRVEDGPAGGSVVRAEVAGAGPGEPERRARSLLGETMRHLERDVSDNFNAG